MNSMRQKFAGKFEILLVDGLGKAQQGVTGLPTNMTIRTAPLTDLDLAYGYGGAEAAIFIGQQEGCEMGAIEAMACGCPVICAKSSSVSEVAGDAAIGLSDQDDKETQMAIGLMTDQRQKASLIERGLRRASRYDWAEMAEGFCDMLRKAHEERTRPDVESFFDRWERLRRIQVEVDIST
jgi:glycosyltransferase involved in cell wall biosynthesis